MTTGCVICGDRCKKSICCSQKLCAAHEPTHDCPRAAQLLAMGPKQIAQWKKDNAHETSLTTKVLERLKLEPGLIAWRTKLQPGAHEGNANEGVLDISGFAAPDGRVFFIETKASHDAICSCKPCKGQREFVQRVRAAGGVALENVRSAVDVVEKLRTGLARVRVPGVEWKRGA